MGEGTIEKLSTTDAFIVLDFPDADVAVGAVRVAPKILTAGAQDMARSQTYRYALFNRKIGGASAGINAAPADRPDAIAAFVSEVQPRVEAGELMFDAAGAMNAADLAALDAVDARNPLRLATVEHTVFADRLTALGAHAAADEAFGGVGALSGKRVAIEGFGAAGPTLAAAAVAYGATVVAVSNTKESASNAGGFDPEVLIAAYVEHGADFINHLSTETKPATHVFGTACDLIYVGSKMGALSHVGAGFVKAKVVVPTAPVVFTTKAMLVLREKGTVVLPGFLTTAAPIFAEWPGTESPEPAAIAAEATEAIRTLTREMLQHADGPVLAACYAAESFLLTWRAALPFGRPFAA